VSEVFPDVALIIAGSGNRLVEIREKAETKNKELGRKTIYTPGGRTDINKLINFSDVFVGISRAALEAMACEKPVILAGPWSFGGLLDDSSIAQAKKDNFTGRSLEQPVTSELLSRAIIEVLEMDKAKRAELGRLGRHTVLENYSAIKMARDTARVYNNILGKGEYSYETDR